MGMKKITIKLLLFVIIADRLCGNIHLHSKRINFYKYMLSCVVVKGHPLLTFDWSPINGSNIFQLLRASIPMGRGTLTIYETSERNTPAAEQLNLHHSLQTNTEKRRCVLLHIYLDRLIVNDRHYTVDDEIIIWILHDLPNLVIRLGRLLFFMGLPQGQNIT